MMSYVQEKTDNLDLANQELIELSLLDERYMKVKNIQIVLISDFENIKKLNYYLFSNVLDVDYFTVDTVDENDIVFFDSMDVIIFNKEDDKLKEMLLHNIKAKNLDTKFFLITNKSYLRQNDILREHVSGVDKLLKMDFFLEDYILSIEKYLRSNFYSKRLLSLADEQEIITRDITRFEKKVDDLVSKKIFFSLINYAYNCDIDIGSYNIRKIVRDNDLIYIDEKKSEITFLLQNVIPEYGAKLIKSRINNFSITLDEKSKLSAFDLIYEK